MPRAISDTFRSALYAPATGEAFLVLITIDHPVLAEPIRVTSDAVDTVSRGETFVRFPFQIELPSDTNDRPPTARLSVDNVSREIVENLRAIGSAPSVLVEIVLGSAPDIVEASFPDFQLSQVHYDALTVQGRLDVEQFTAEPYPAGVFSPADFPGLF